MRSAQSVGIAAATNRKGHTLSHAFWQGFSTSSQFQAHLRHIWLLASLFYSQSCTGSWTLFVSCTLLCGRGRRFSDIFRSMHKRDTFRPGVAAGVVPRIAAGCAPPSLFIERSMLSIFFPRVPPHVSGMPLSVAFADADDSLSSAQHWLLQARREQFCGMRRASSSVCPDGVA